MKDIGKITMKKIYIRKCARYGHLNSTERGDHFLITMWNFLLIPSDESKSISRRNRQPATKPKIFGLNSGLGLTQEMFGPSGDNGDSCNSRL